MVRTGRSMNTAAVAVCGLVFVASIVTSWMLARFLRGCDRREADMLAVAEAERIVRESAAAR